MSKPTIAFFGATGGCVINALTLTLQNGYNAVAFVRTPAKLTKMLTGAPHSIPQNVLDSQLAIVQGNIDNVTSIKSVFAHSPSVIVSGVGGAPKLQASLLRPVTLDQPTICADATANIVKALKELEAANKLAVKPFVIVIGTTGMSHTRDVPVAFLPFYHVVLAMPHKDKGNMEKIVIGAAKETPSVLSGYSIVRPSLLMDGPSQGVGKIRMGWERHMLDSQGEKGPGPAVGYTIRRADIGLWIYENLIKGDSKDWSGRCVSLTY